MLVTMQVLKWTQRRLQRLFRFYRTYYWDGQLREYRLIPRRLRKGIVGWYECPRKRIYIDLLQIPKTEYVKRIVLHEMIHAVTWRSGGHHGEKFFLRC
jgi:predicted SprT family Zn-dependent metalloprotease